MPPAGFEPAIPASGRPQTHALVRPLGSAREEHRLRIFKNTTIRIFGPNREEVKEGCRKRNFKIALFTNYYYGDQINEGDMRKASGTYGKNRNAYRVLVESQLRIPRPRWRMIFKCILKD
jgi:hypothetical protein